MDESKCIRSWCSTAVDHRVCFARYISAYKEERVNASQVLPKPEGFEFTGDKQEFVEKIREALYFSKIMSYAQGFAQLRPHQKSMIGNCHLVKLLKSGVQVVSFVRNSCKNHRCL